MPSDSAAMTCQKPPLSSTTEAKDAAETTIPNRQMLLMNNARESRSFDPSKLESIICVFSEESVRRRRESLGRVEATLGETDSSKLPQAYCDTGRTAVYHEGLAMAKALMQEEIRCKHGIFIHATHHHAPLNASPFGLHYAMFIPTLKLQASPEQLAYWLPLAESGKIIGTYCQTEIGHGTFVRGLETTATFDLDADQFIIHSPTVSATKFWPGGLGYSCSHAMVMAQLIINGKHHGVHPFIVQLRSLEDYKPLPGIELGDIGPKLNLNSTDNGYAVFTNIRIPRDHMMMGYSKVLRDGTLSFTLWVPNLHRPPQLLLAILLSESRAR